jgi:hypothetical protein
LLADARRFLVGQVYLAVELRSGGQPLLENVSEKDGPSGSHGQNQKQKASIHFPPKATRHCL